MKKIFVFLTVFLGISWVFAQQNEFFKEAKARFDAYENELNSRFKQHYFLIPDEDRPKFEKEYNLVKSRIDSVRNTAYLEALIKTKVAFDLANLPSLQTETEPKTINNKIAVQKNPPKVSENADPEYPTGISGLREEVIHNFYTAGINPEPGVLSTSLIFVVEKDGNIGEVTALGEHHGFNKQAEIALYLLSHRFKPGINGGIPVRSRFRFPVKMSFE